MKQTILALLWMLLVAVIGVILFGLLDLVGAKISIPLCLIGIFFIIRAQIRA
jgi:hypothetical protein